MGETTKIMDLPANWYDEGQELLAAGRRVGVTRNQGVFKRMDKAHFHTYFEIYIQERGDRYHFASENYFHIHAGEIYIFPPFQMHRSTAADAETLQRSCIYFDPNVLSSAEVYNHLVETEGIYAFTPDTFDRLEQLIDAMLAEQEHRGLYSDEYQQTLLNAFVMILLRENTEIRHSSSKNQMSDVVTYIDEHYRENISLQTLVDQFYISSSHLSREFKKFTNCTIIQYVNLTRIRHAEMELERSNKTITEIALSNGFDNPTHFNRTFLKLNGITPSQYRKMRRGTGRYAMNPPINETS